VKREKKSSGKRRFEEMRKKQQVTQTAGRDD
jgi:hypothetical protein